MGHLGILPQSQKGKFRYKGKTSLERKRLLADAMLLQKNGVFVKITKAGFYESMVHNVDHIKQNGTK